MKNILFACAFVLLSVAFTSCNTGKVVIANHRSEMHESKEAASGCFVVYNDGSKQRFNTLTMRTGIFVTPCLIANGVQKIAAGDIVSYQTLHHYAVSQKKFISGRQTAVATEALPGFAVRIAKGSINVYSKKFYNGRVAVDEYFVQKGDQGPIMAYTAETINLLVADDPQALEFFLSKQYRTPGSSKEKYSKSKGEQNMLVAVRKK